MRIKGMNRLPPKRTFMSDDQEDQFKITNRNLVVPYFAPYFAYVTIAILFGGRLPQAWTYGIKLIIVPALMMWAWRRYVPLTGPKRSMTSIAVGIVAGIFGCLLWILLLKPFVNPFEGEAWIGLGFILKLGSVSLVVPIFEELLMRGFIFRVALQWDHARKDGVEDPFKEAFDDDNIMQVEPGAWSLWAVAISTLAFTLGHHVDAWLAAIIYGLLMAGLWIVRKDLLSCIVAHGVTNFTLALYVRSTGQWGLW